MHDGKANMIAATNEQVQEIARSLDMTEQEVRELLEEANEAASLPINAEPAARMAEVLKVFARSKRPIPAGGKVIENITLINQHERVGRNARCPNHKEFKFKKCPHGCSREPRKMVGRVTKKIVTD